MNFKDLTPEERAELGKRGGDAKAKAYKERKRQGDQLVDLLKITLKDGRGANIKNIKNMDELESANLTTQELVLVKQIEKALKGDTRAAAFIRDTIGEKPTEKLQATFQTDEQLKALKEQAKTEALDELLKELPTEIIKQIVAFYESQEDEEEQEKEQEEADEEEQEETEDF